MPKFNVYVPQKLRDAMRAARHSEKNWSRIACHAFAEACGTKDAGYQMEDSAEMAEVRRQLEELRQAVTSLTHKKK